MSIKIMSAVWDLPMPAMEKLVLLSLADQAGNDGVCWPAIKSIALRCGRDERSVRRTIAKLVEAGHVSRIVRNGTSNLWHVHPCGDKQDGLFRYVYRIESDDGQFYIGRRKSVSPPQSDDYMGSGNWVNYARSEGLPLRKVVLSSHNDDAELAEAEARAIEANIENPMCKNKRREGGGQNDRGAYCHTPHGQNDRGGLTMQPPKPSVTVNEPSSDCSSDNELKPEHVAKKWNEIAVSIGLRPIRDLTPERRQLVRARIAQYGIDDFVEVFGKVAASPFLRGERNWRGATFDWVMKKANFQKILEGNYDD